MIHQAKKEGEVRLIGPALEQGEDVVRAAAVKQEVGVLHPFRDAAIGLQLADGIGGEEVDKFPLVDVGVNGHGSR